MKPVRSIIIAVAALGFALTGCTVTYIHRDETSATALRASIGTDSAVGDLTLADGKGATLQVKRHTLGQTDGLATAAEVGKAAVSPVPIPLTN